MPLSPIRVITSVNVDPLQLDLGFEDADQQRAIPQAIDLNFQGADTQYSTHSIHPYVAAINPPLARTLITHYVPQGETVLDPFCGGGGVLVEAILAGREAVGCDVNPLAAIISRVKTRHLPLRETMPEYRRILDCVRSRVRLSDEDIPEVIRYWYKEETLAPLRALQVAVAGTTSEAVRELFQVVLSATARDVMLTYRGEIRLRRLQGEDLEKIQPSCDGCISEEGKVAMGRVSQLPIDCSARVLLRDAKELGQEEICHSIVSSPPYADDTNGVGYFQFSRNMLYWIGVSLDDQKRHRQDFLGSRNIKPSETIQVPSKTLRQVLAVIEQRNSSHHKQALSFYQDYYRALAVMASVVAERVIIIIGDRVLSRTYINNGHITTEFMDTLGFGLEHYYTRELKKKRIANLGGDGGGTSVEHILVYRRP